MSSNIYTAGLQNVGSYQVSGIPYATGSVCPNGAIKGLGVTFPYVTRWVEVMNYDTTYPLFVGFSSNGIREDSANNYFIKLPAATSEVPVISTGKMEMKLSQIWVSGSGTNTCGVVAGLTNLPVSRLNNANKINWSGSAGVG
jgi:hypothetical protein